MSINIQNFRHHTTGIMKKILTVTTVGFFALSMSYCTPKVAKGVADEAVPTPEQMKAQFTTAQLDEGKMIWQSNCNKCHKLFDPGSRTPEKWNRVLNRMIPKAKLTPDQGKLVRAYLIAHAKTE
jgi:uncharacterized membrane protein